MFGGVNNRGDMFREVDELVEAAMERDLSNTLSRCRAEMRRNKARDDEADKRILTEQYFGPYWAAGEGGSVGSIGKEIEHTIHDNFCKTFSKLQDAYPELKQQFPSEVQAYSSSLNKIISLSDIVQERSRQMKNAINYNSADKAQQLYEQLMKSDMSNYDSYKQETEQALSAIGRLCLRHKHAAEAGAGQVDTPAAANWKAQEEERVTKQEEDNATARSQLSEAEHSAASSLTVEQRLRLEMEEMRKHYQEAIAKKEEESRDKDRIIAEKDKIIELQTREKAERDALLKREMAVGDDLRDTLKWTREQAEKQKAEAFELAKLQADNDYLRSKQAKEVSWPLTSLWEEVLNPHTDPVEHNAGTALALAGADADQYSAHDC